MALTDVEIRKSRSGPKAYSLADSRGLYLWVTTAGGKLWRWGYRYCGKEKLMSFGRYPDVGLAAARELHSEARRLLASGVDPMAARKAARDAQRVSSERSFETIASQWLAHWRTGKTLRHADTVDRRMKANILPHLGSKPIDEIEAPEIVAMLKAIEQRGVSNLAKRALETVSQVYRFAIAHGLTRRNPAADIKPRDVLLPSKRTNLARIDARELPALLRKIEVYQGTHVTRFALKLMALTFVRTSELIGARWDEFDLEQSRWDLPKARMKMRTPHIVPLATQAVEVLTLLREITGSSPWLFPGDRSKAKSMSNNTILKALERMGFKGRMTGHASEGLRRLCCMNRATRTSISSCNSLTRRATPSARPTITLSTSNQERK